MVHRLRTIAFALFLVVAVSNQEAFAEMAGWTCYGVYNGCTLDEGSYYDCYSCPLESICWSYGGFIQYSECVEDHEYWTWTQVCDCILW
jgi:hypothetical protein